MAELEITPGTEFQVQLIHITPDGGTMRLWAIDEGTYHFIANNLGPPHSEMYVPADAMIKAHNEHIAEAIIVDHRPE